MFADEIKMSAQAMAFFNAGEGTTSILLTLCLYEMAMNMDIQEKLRKEIRSNLDSTGSLPYETILNMEYLDMVTKGNEYYKNLFRIIICFPQKLFANIPSFNYCKDIV